MTKILHFLVILYAKQEKVIVENKGDRVFTVHKTKMLTEYRGKGIRSVEN